jgi:hypothetical protein
MEERSRRRVRDLVTQLAFEGLSENEIGRARISIMARSNPLHRRAGYRRARPVAASQQIQLATHGRSIQRWVTPHTGHMAPQTRRMDVKPDTWHVKLDTMSNRTPRQTGHHVKPDTWHARRREVGVLRVRPCKGAHGSSPAASTRRPGATIKGVDEAIWLSSTLNLG